MRVAYAGEPGAFGEQAARAVDAQAEPVPCASFLAVAQAVQAGEVDAGVIPIENRIAGAVSEGIAAVLAVRPPLCGEVRVRVRHLLLARPGTGMEQLVEVHSHPQALAQCQGFLERHGLRAVRETNTATAARLVAEGRWPNGAAIASRAAAQRYGLSVIAEGIANVEPNETRFYVLGRMDGGGARTVRVVGVPSRERARARSEDRSYRSGDTGGELLALLELGDGEAPPWGAVLLGTLARAPAPDQTDASASTSS